MLNIGHRGAKGLAPENTLEALQAGYDAGADMLEFDVRLTADKVPILAHNPKLHGVWIRRTTYRSLKKRGTVTTLDAALDAFYGKILLNIELKPTHDVDTIYEAIAKRCIKKLSDWDSIIISSFHVRDLLQLRRLNPYVNLALLHSLNPFAFVTYQRRLQLAAVGWHRLHVNNLAIEIAKKSGIFTYVYTVNRPDAAQKFEQRGIDGIVTDYPDRIQGEL
jgi:glycerophosphoryl diester phosphodiesterase